MKQRTVQLPLLLFLLILSSCVDSEDLSLTEQLANAQEPPFTLTSWEDSLLNADGIPDAPKENYLQAPDGLQLAYRDWIPDNWQDTGAMVLFIHGSTSHSGHYTVIGEALSHNGIFARIIDVRGLGLSVRKSENSTINDFTPRTFNDNSHYYTGRIGDSYDANALVRDLSLHISTIKETFPKAQLFLGGHSSGGGIVSRYIESVGDFAIDGTILCAPFNHSEQPQNRKEMLDKYAIIDYGALGDAIRGNHHRYVIGFNLGDLPGLELSVVQYSYNTMIGSAVSEHESFHQTFSKPLLWIHGDEDKLFNKETCITEFQKFPNMSGKNQFSSINNTSHIGLTWSREVVDTIAHWIHALPDTE